MLPFARTFEALTGHAPFPWQERLFQIWVKGDFSMNCVLPTGVGKTSVVAIWLICLASNPKAVPRRMVYVVNRRTVVDQTTTEVERIVKNLDAAGLDGHLRRLGVFKLDPDESALAVSPLRGQMADNRLCLPIPAALP